MAGKRRQGAHHEDKTSLTFQNGKAIADDETMRIAERLTPPVYDAIGNDDKRIADAKARITLKRFSWE